MQSIIVGNGRPNGSTCFDLRLSIIGGSSVILYLRISTHLLLACRRNDRRVSQAHASKARSGIALSDRRISCASALPATQSVVHATPRCDRPCPPRSTLLRRAPSCSESTATLGRRQTRAPS